MRLALRITGGLALVSYLIMGMMLYFTIIPGAQDHFPPDFRLLGYDAAAITPFVTALTESARDSYAALLTMWDRVFIVALALWLAVMGWRDGPLRFVIAGLAVLYAIIDLAENAAIYRAVFVDILEPGAVAAASSLTKAKFASLYLTVLVLIVQWRRRTA